MTTSYEAGYFSMMRRWLNMMNRCYNRNCNMFCLYGARGIQVCEEWHEFKPFYEFFGDPPFVGASIDRIDNGASYEPLNCRWATQKLQNINTRRNKVITYDGQSRILTEWARIYNVSPQRLSERLRRGWTFEQAIRTPCPKGYDLGKRMSNQNSQAYNKEKGRQYQQASSRRRLSGAVNNAGLLLNARNHGNLSPTEAPDA